VIGALKLVMENTSMRRCVVLQGRKIVGRLRPDANRLLHELTNSMVLPRNIHFNNIYLATTNKFLFLICPVRTVEWQQRR